MFSNLFKEMYMYASMGMEVNPKSYQIAHKAIDYAMSSLMGADPLVPFAMTWRQDEPFVERFMIGAYDDSIEMAMRYVNGADDGVSGYAVVWNGYVNVDGKTVDAIVAEVGDRHSNHAFQVAQPYVEQREGMVAAEGDLLAVGESENLLKVKLSQLNLHEHLVKPFHMTTDIMMHEVTTQPYAQMPIALMCLAANLYDGDERTHIVQGIRKLQAMEADHSVPMCHHVFSVLMASIADGELMNVLPSDDMHDMAQIVVEGGRQVMELQEKGQICALDARSYIAAVRTVMEAALADEGKRGMPAGAEKLRLLFKKATGS